MSVNVAGHLAKRKVVKDLRGQIIDLIDENNGGWIIKGRQIVNQARWDELQKIEADRREAAKAASMAVAAQNAAAYAMTPKQAEEASALKKRLCRVQKRSRQQV